MRILIIRHADPDYSIDSLTERGKVEADLLGGYLSSRLDRENTYFYVSPLGRAKDTAKYTLDRLGANAETLDWLSEFCPPVRRPNTDRDSVPWDWLPEDWTAEDRFYSAEKWTEPEVMVKGEVGKAATLRYTGLDSLLEKHGYV